MFTLIRCENCGGNPVGKGSTPVTVEAVEFTEPCGDCNHRAERKDNYHFCGTPCLLEYLIRNRGLKCHSYQCKNGKDTLNKGRDCIFCKGTGFKANGKWDQSEGSFPP